MVTTTMPQAKLDSGFKATEVGVIPEDWGVKTAGEICIKIQDGTHFSPKLGGDDYLYVTSKKIGQGVLDVSDAERISAAEHTAIYSRCDVKRGDLLLTKDGANTGNAAINCLDEEFSLLSSVAFLRFAPNVHEPAFYLQYILSSFGQTRLKQLMSGNAITRLTLQKIRAFRFPVPPIYEQRAIATVLGDVDAEINSLDVLITKKRNIRLATIQQLLRGKTRLPGFSGSWQARRLGEIAQIAMGGTPSRRNPQYWGRGHKWLSIADLKGKYVYDTKEEITDLAATRMQVIPRGTLVMSFKLTIGKLAFTGDDMYSNEAICSLSRLRADAEFMYYVLGQTDFSLYGKQAVKGYTLNLESLNAVEVPYPPMPEQRAIAIVLSDMDAEIIALERRVEKTRAVKQGMMQELLTGRRRLV